MARHAELTPGGSPVSGAGASLPQVTKPRALVRMDTNEEYERVQKKQTWQMQVELEEMQQQMASRRTGSAGPSQ